MIMTGLLNYLPIPNHPPTPTHLHVGKEGLDDRCRLGHARGLHHDRVEWPPPARQLLLEHAREVGAHAAADATVLHVGVMG